MPRGAEDDEVAAADLRDPLRPDLVAGGRAGDPADHRVGCTVEKVDSPDVGTRAVEQIVDDDIVAVRQNEKVAAELLAADIRTGQIGSRRGVGDERAEADHHRTDQQRSHGGRDRGEARTNH